MAYPNAHHYLVIQGITSSAGQTDDWQTGIRLVGDSAGSVIPSGAALTAALDDVAADVTAWWSVVRHWYPVSTFLTGVKFNPIGTDGRYVSDDASVARAIGGATGIGGDRVSGGGPLPTQLSVAVTLLTAAGRGLASKGRMYLPAPATAAVAADGAVDATYRTEVGQATATLLTALGNWPGVDAAGAYGEPYVMSSVREGDANKVTGVSIGSRFDVQRRRANKIRETRGTVYAVS